jgi:metal-sulfur cluster biosynthetic enzyme
MKKETEEKVHQLIGQVNHPAINDSLQHLGIIQSTQIKDENVEVVFAFPFPNIPIADQLIGSVARPLSEIGVQMKYRIVVMTEEEKARFMQLEAEGWKGM